jgi:hypothetical protein
VPTIGATTSTWCGAFAVASWSSPTSSGAQRTRRSSRCEKMTYGPRRRFILSFGILHGAGHQVDLLGLRILLIFCGLSKVLLLRILLIFCRSAKVSGLPGLRTRCGAVQMLMNDGLQKSAHLRCEASVEFVTNFFDAYGIQNKSAGFAASSASAELAGEIANRSKAAVAFRSS